MGTYTSGSLAQQVAGIADTRKPRTWTGMVAEARAGNGAQIAARSEVSGTANIYDIAKHPKYESHFSMPREKPGLPLYAFILAGLVAVGVSCFKPNLSDIQTRNYNTSSIQQESFRCAGAECLRDINGVINYKLSHGASGTDKAELERMLAINKTYEKLFADAGNDFARKSPLVSDHRAKIGQ